MKNDQLNTEKIELKKSMKQMKKENVYKRLKRKETKCTNMEEKLMEMKDNETHLKSKIDKMKNRKNGNERNQIIKQKTNEISYLKQKCEKLKQDFTNASAENKEIVKRNSVLEKTVDDLECQLQAPDNILNVYDGSKYSDNLRKCVLQLQSLDLPCNKIGQVIDSVSSNIFHTDLNKIPSRSTLQNILDEGHVLARNQVADELLNCTNWDLFADGTSRDGKKILDAGVHLDDNRTLSLGFKAY